MKLFLGTRRADAALLRMTLEHSLAEAAGTLSAQLAILPGDPWPLAVGDAVRLLDDKDTVLFLGGIHQLDREEHTVTLLAYDPGIYLTRNELYGVYAGTGEQIIRKVAGQLELPLGRLDAAPGRHTILTHAGQTAFSVLRQAAGADRCIRMEENRLTVTPCGEETVDIDATRVLDMHTRVSIGGMVNRAVVVNTKGVALACAENVDDLARYGQLQTVRLRSGTDFYPQALSYLRRKTLRADLVLPGNASLRCGISVRLAQPEWGLDGVWPVVALTHAWEGGIFTTELTLEVDRP